MKAAGLPLRFGSRGLRHYFAMVLIFGWTNVKSVQLAMWHTTPTITLITYVGYWPDAVDQTRTLVDSARLSRSWTGRGCVSCLRWSDPLRYR